MKLLFDENVSHVLATRLASYLPGSAHVRDVGLRGAPDSLVWAHAQRNGFTIVSEDADFRERSVLEGSPPRVIWLDVRNASTDAIAALIVRERGRILQFGETEDAAVLILSTGFDAI